MLTYPCRCGATLFFDNVCCVACGVDCGWCDACQRVVPIEPAGDGDWRCGGQGCGAAVSLCDNRTRWDACNALVAGSGIFCRSCQSTTLAPNLYDDTLRDHWRGMEAAKRRLLYGLDRLGVDWETSEPRLTFRFPADTADRHYTTGHENGVVTINLKEADAVERERVRQRFAEPHRTLIGHLRHEASHWIWQVLVQGRLDEEFAQAFGAPDDPPYADAMPRYYDQGPPDDWQDRYISRYASSHPWEDFAETTAFYLDMRSVLETAAQHFRLGLPQDGDCGPLLAAYQRLGVGLNEVNRSLGLTDALPEVVSPAVAEKVAWVHGVLAPPKRRKAGLRWTALRTARQPSPSRPG